MTTADAFTFPHFGSPPRLYALFKGDQQISKAHSTVQAVRIEALQSNLVLQSGGRQFWPEGYDVKELHHDGSVDHSPTDMIEALADAWASIDGKLDRFRANKIDRSLDEADGTYPGYMFEAEEMIMRLRRRGFVVISEEAANL